MCLAGIQKPDAYSVSLNMITLTPLYTGGIGQWGDQIHPSGLLGSIRHFSCLVARTLGDATFEQEVWGKVGVGQNDTHAKRIALCWDFSDLSTITFSPNKLLENETFKGKGWHFNQAQYGSLKLKLTQHGISDAHWNILLIALRIQIRHASFGAKDQFGLGVMTSNNLPTAEMLDINQDFSNPHLSKKSFAFLKIHLKQGFGKTSKMNISQPESLKLGLRCRIALRSALRPTQYALGDARNAWDWKTIRHRMMGALGEYGSAVNVSAAYQLPNDEQTLEIRIFMELPLDKPEERKEVLTLFNSAIKKLELDDWRIGPPEWNIGDDMGKTKNPADRINKLAGLEYAK